MDKYIILKDIQRAIEANMNQGLPKAYSVYKGINDAIKELIERRVEDLQEESDRNIFYFSFEYMPGSFLVRNLIYLDLLNEIKTFVEELGMSFEEIHNMDYVQNFGLGGSGDASFSYLDMTTSQGLSLDAYGIYYSKTKYEEIKFQNLGLKEDTKNFWEQSQSEEIELDFARDKIKVLGHDFKILGYENPRINNLRLWDLQLSKDVSLESFNGESIKKVNLNHLMDPSLNYEEESDEELIFLKEYYFSCASIKDIMGKIEKGVDLNLLRDKYWFYLSDFDNLMLLPIFIYEYSKRTHASIDESLSLAQEIFVIRTKKVGRDSSLYWSKAYFERYCPWILPILEKTNEEFTKEINQLQCLDDTWKFKEDLKIIDEEFIHKFPLAVYGTKQVLLSINEQMEKIQKEFSDLYRCYYRKFTISRPFLNQRTWIIEGNPRLHSFLKEKDLNWNKNTKDFSESLVKVNTYELATEFESIKLENKIQFANTYYKNVGLKINPYSIFDVNVDDFRLGRRQLLVAFYIAHLYMELKESPNYDYPERTFFFLGRPIKNCPYSYRILSFLKSISKSIDEDKAIKEKLKIIFMDFRNMDTFLSVIPIADIGEQLSLPGSELAFNSALQFMANGAVILGSKTSTNIGFRNVLGEKNIRLFGVDYKDVYFQEKYNYYRVDEYIQGNLFIQKFLTRFSLIDDGRLKKEFKGILQAIKKSEDQNLLFHDLEEYVLRQNELGRMFRDGSLWKDMSLQNFITSLKFTTDRSLDLMKDKVGL